MVHRTTETDWKSLYEAETRISAKQAAEIVGLREQVKEARESLSIADKMLSDHIEKFHDYDYEPHQVPAELADLHNIEHHLMGSLILDDDIASFSSGNGDQ